MKKLILYILFSFLFVASNKAVALELKSINNIKLLQEQVIPAMVEEGFDIKDESVKAQAEQVCRLLEEMEQKHQANGGDPLGEEWLTWKKRGYLVVLIAALILCKFYLAHRARKLDKLQNKLQKLKNGLENLGNAFGVVPEGT